MDELAEKWRRVEDFIVSNRVDALYLSQVANFAWLTGGREPVVMLSSDRAEAGLFISPEKRIVVCNTIEFPRLRDEDRLGDQGYEFHVSPWYQGAPGLGSLADRKRIAADWPIPGMLDLSAEIARLRFQLTSEEVIRYREVGIHTAQALERTAGQIRPGMSEMQIAGLLSANAMEVGITPTLLLVGTDERIFHYRHPIPTMKELEKYAMLVICGRRWGLVASATRVVHFGNLPPEIEAKQTACAYVDAVYNASTVVGARVDQIFRSTMGAYAEVGFPDEWKKHNQGGSAGYLSRDYEGSPESEEIVLEEQGFAWNPSITGIKSEDTAIVHKDGIEFITATGNWPVLEVNINQKVWKRPKILTI